jgi:hypothetical protein
MGTPENDHPKNVLISIRYEEFDSVHFRSPAFLFVRARSPIGQNTRSSAFQHTFTSAKVRDRPPASGVSGYTGKARYTGGPLGRGTIPMEVLSDVEASSAAGSINWTRSP